MGNIDEKRLSVLLGRIDNIRAELEALENEVRGLGPASEPAEALDIKEDIPIEIDIQGIDLPPVVDDQAAEYPVASTVGEPCRTTVPPSNDIPAAEPSSPAIGAAEVSVPVEKPGSSGTVTPAEVPASQPSDDLPFDDDLPVTADEPSAIPEPVILQGSGPVQTPETYTEPEIVATRAPEPKPKAAILDCKKAETAVMDVMAETQAWRTDRPGSQVKNVISAISLNDRVLLINVLFREDPLLFQSAISAFNGMTSLDEALAYIRTNFPDWDLNSEPVYRLMMAVRRKLGNP